jgi:hypothetical protein
MVLATVAAVECGGAGSSSGSEQPAAARDTRVQPAVGRSAAPARARAAGAGAGAGVDDAGAGAGGVLRGTFTGLNGERDDLSRLPRRRRARRQHRDRLRLHAAVRETRALYRAHRSDGFVVLGFPANDFAGQEPRSDSEIAEFCKATYGVTFPDVLEDYGHGSGRQPADPAPDGGRGSTAVELQHVPRRPARGRSSRGSPRGASRTLGSCGSGCGRCCDPSGRDVRHPQPVANLVAVAAGHRRLVSGGLLDPVWREGLPSRQPQPCCRSGCRMRRRAGARAGEDVELPSEAALRRDARNPRGTRAEMVLSSDSARNAATTCASMSVMAGAGSFRRVSSKVAPDPCSGTRSTRV